MWANANPDMCTCCDKHRYIYKKSHYEAYTHTMHTLTRPLKPIRKIVCKSQECTEKT